MERNVVGWFEIPVDNMERAMRFYSKVFGVELERHQMGQMDMAWFPMIDGPGAAGSLVKHDAYRPSQEGTLVYFTAHSGDCATELGRVESADGKVLQEKKSIGEHGFVGVFLDTAGNRVAVHSLK